MHVKLRISIFILLMTVLSCSKDNPCVIDDVLGDYEGTLTCNDVTKNVNGKAFYGIDSKIMTIGDEFSFDYIRCEYEFDQYAEFRNNYVDLYYKYKFESDQFTLFYEKTEDGETTICEVKLEKL